MPFGWLEIGLRPMCEELILSRCCDSVVVVMMETGRQETNVEAVWSKGGYVPADLLAREVHIHELGDIIITHYQWTAPYDGETRGRGRI